MTNTAAAMTAVAAPGGNRITVDVAADNALAARLNHPRAEVVSALGVAIEKGGEIRDRRIRYQEDLDEARLAKLKWTQAANDLLLALFDNSAVADYCNDWVGKLFPEYAEFGNFVEQFYEEMEYRLAKLRAVLQRVEQVAETTTTTTNLTVAEKVTPIVAAPHVPVVANPAPAPARVNAPMKAGVAHAPVPPVGASSVLLLGASPTDATHAGAAELLKRLNVVARAAQDPFAAGAADVAVFIVPPQPSDPAANRMALFHLGCAVGRLGAGRVCVLRPAGTNPFAEVDIAHITVDAGGGWQLQLLRHLKQAGMDVDLNKLC